MMKNNNLKRITFISNTCTLVGNLVEPFTTIKQVGVLILHGAGKSSKERFRELQEILMSQGYISLAFDFHGVGESEGKFEDGTLSNRLKDAQAALEELQKCARDICLIGCSMGGHR